MTKFLENLWPYLLYSLFILYLCVLPSPELPDGVDDKTAHFLAFSGVGFLGHFYWKKHWKNFLAGAAFGWFIEIVQGLLPPYFHRSFDSADALADAVGVLIGILFALLFEKFIIRKAHS